MNPGSQSNGRDNKLASSRQECEALLANDPTNAALRARLAVLELRDGRIAQAEEQIRRAIELAPQTPDYRFTLGKVLTQANRPNEALACFEEVAELRPDMAVAWNGAGQAWAALGHPEKAMVYFRRAVGIDPDLAAAHYNLAIVHRAQGETRSAITCLRKAIDLQPDDGQAHHALGVISLEAGRFTEALAAFTNAARLMPEKAGSHNNLAAALLALGRHEEAGQSARTALSIDSGNADAYCNLGMALRGLRRYDDAAANYDKALALDSDHAEALVGKASILELHGSYQAALDLLEDPSRRNPGNPHLAIQHAHLLQHLGRPEQAVAVLEGLISQDFRDLDARGAAHMLLGALYDELEQYDTAIKHFHRGNALRQSQFDPDKNEALVQQIIDFFDEERLRRSPRSEVLSQRPVFIVGMPRSGTSLLEQMIAAHEDMFGAGESGLIGELATRLCANGVTYPDGLADVTVEDLNRTAHEYLERIGPQRFERITDKMPRNFLYLGLIQMIFPAARVIHCVRDPLDTCLSCYFQDFNNLELDFSRDLHHTAAYYRHYHRLMEHWKRFLTIPLLDVAYEDLITNPEDTLRAILDFLALPWDENCLRFHELDRVVDTASHAQVRRPIYHSSVGRHRHYQEHIKDLEIELGSLGSKPSSLKGVRPDSSTRIVHGLLRQGHEAIRARSPETAEARFNEVLKIAKDSVPALQGLAIVCHARGDYARAGHFLKRAIEIDPENPHSHNNLGIVLQTQGQFRAALVCFETATKLRPDFAEAHCNTGKIWQILGDLERAAASFHHTLKLSPGHPEALAGLAVQAELKGEYEKGLSLIRPLVDSGRITAELAVTYANLQRRLKNHEAATAMAENALRTADTAAAAMHLHFVLGDLYDDVGEYDRAFAHYQQANRASPMIFQPGEYGRTIERIEHTYSADMLATLARATPHAPIPVFIVGMPRSGTSVVEQILAGHPQLWAAGELDALGTLVSRLPQAIGSHGTYPECIAELTADRLEDLAAEYRKALGNGGQGVTHFTDKMPANFEHLGLIELMFPNARIVHCVRDPLDTALSCYFQNFSAQGLAFSFRLEHIAHYYRQYRRLMTHWQKVLSLPIMNLEYEMLVSEPETTVARLCGHVGISTRPELLAIAERGRHVPTASHAQVRESLHTRSVGRWKHYAKHLEPLKRDLKSNDA